MVGFPGAGGASGVLIWSVVVLTRIPSFRRPSSGRIHVVRLFVAELLAGQVEEDILQRGEPDHFGLLEAARQ